MLWETLGPQQEALGGGRGEEGRVREFKRNKGVRLQRFPWVTTPVHPLPPRAGSVDDLKPTSLRVLRERTRRGASDHANVQQAPRRPRSEPGGEVQATSLFPRCIQTGVDGKLKSALCGNNHQEALLLTRKP